MIFKNAISRILVLLVTGIFVAACGESPSQSGDGNQAQQVGPSTESELNEETVDDEIQVIGRWYSSSQVATGAEVFAQNCAICHGPNAEGTVDDWRQRLDDGSFPPPPLDGSAHAWHHPTSMLLQVINNGGEAFGGKMPPFLDVLEDSDKLAAIAYFQNFWTDEIYNQWEQMGGTN